MWSFSHASSCFFGRAKLSLSICSILETGDTLKGFYFVVPYFYLMIAILRERNNNFGLNGGCGGKGSSYGYELHVN